MRIILIALVALCGCSSRNTVVIEVGSEKINFIQPKTSTASLKVKYECGW